MTDTSTQALIHIISLGAGVQSSTMALMAAHGEIEPMPQCAIFADTQSEPSTVYRHLDWLEGMLPFPVHRVTRGSLRNEILAGMRGEARIDGKPPFFTSSGGMMRRQCTQDYKILPIQRKIKELLNLGPRDRWPAKTTVIQWIGISLDEAQRVKPSRVSGVEMRWPLLEQRMTRLHCLAWLRNRGFPVPPKSACTFCPYHDDALWRDMKLNDHEAFADAVALDKAIRKGDKTSWFVHRTLRPLDQVDFSTAEDAGQGRLFGDECEGMCGV